MKKAMLMCLCIFLTTAAYAGKFAVKINLGGTYLMGGDYNKGIEGFRDYELSVLGVTETFVDEMKKLGLGYQLGAELLYNFNPNLAAGIEAGYLGASVTSHLERTWHNYKWTVNPSLAVIPLTLNIHYFMPLGKKMKLHAMAGAGAFICNLDYMYNMDNTTSPYNGTWTPDTKTVFGAKAGIGIEYPLAGKFSLTFDMTGRYASIKGFTGAWHGIYNGVAKSGTGTLYSYNYVDSNGSWPMFGIYETVPSGAHMQNIREATFSLSGVSLLVGVKIIL
jgi:hypothetical protein